MQRVRSIVPILSLLTILGAVAPAARAGDVLVVGPGERFATIATAVVSAADGDTVLVKSGTYGPFTVQGYGISIVADAGANVTVTGGVVVVSVIAGRTVLLDGLTIQSQAPGVACLGVLSVAGSVRVQRCTLLGAGGSGFLADCNTVAGNPDAGATVQLSAAQDVAFTRCTIVGGDGSTVFDLGCAAMGFAWPGGDGGAGLALISSRATVYDGEIHGGSAGGGTLGGRGGFGASASSGSLLVLVNASVTGGDGGAALDPFTPTLGGAGGHALSLNLGAQGKLLDCQLAGGVGGSGPAGQGAAGQSIFGPGVATLWPGESKSLTLGTVLREGESTTVSVTGEPGELASLFVSLHAGALLVPKAKGVLLLGVQSLLGPLVLGAIGPGGSASVDAQMPDVPAGLLGIDVWLQAAVGAGASATLSSWGHLTLLDAAL